MLAGIDNFFVLEKMFGPVDCLTGAEVCTLKLVEGRVHLEIKTPHEILCKPRRWMYEEPKTEEGAYLSLTLHAVSTVRITAYRAPLKIAAVEENIMGDQYQLELIFEGGQRFRCVYCVGRIDHVQNRPRTPAYLPQ